MQVFRHKNFAKLSYCHFSESFQNLFNIRRTFRLTMQDNAGHLQINHGTLKTRQYSWGYKKILKLHNLFTPELYST